MNHANFLLLLFRSSSERFLVLLFEAMATSMKLPIDTTNTIDTESKSLKSISAWSKALGKLGSAARRLAGSPDVEGKIREECEDERLSDTSSDDTASTTCTPLSDKSADSEVVLSPSMLMKFRFAVDDNDADKDAGCVTCKAQLQPLSYENAPSSISKVVAPVRRHQSFQPLSPTAGSWIAHQRSTSGSNLDNNEKVGRAARSILNKITADTFDALFEQLVTCGIDKPEHISTIMSEVFEKATKQHGFIPMYADICVKLEEDPRIAAIVEAAGHQHNFRRLLLNQCQVVFEQLLEPRAEKQVVDEEDCLRRKQEALGNIKLIGHLLVNGMLGSKLLVECAEELISKRTSCYEALESLAALMMVASPTFDTTEWHHYEKLNKCFDTMRKLSKDKSIVARSRFLLRDVLDLREAGWATCLRNPAVIRAEQSKDRSTEQVPNEHAESGTAEVFDLKSFRRNLAAILGDLTSDRNVSNAVQRVRMAQVPMECQAEQFVDILTRIVEEKRGPPRRCAMAFAAGLGAAEAPAFEREQCLAGMLTFFQDVYPDLCNEVPRLPAIVRSEFTPTFCSVFPQAEINNCLPPGVRF